MHGGRLEFALGAVEFAEWVAVVRDVEAGRPRERQEGSLNEAGARGVEGGITLKSSRTTWLGLGLMAVGALLAASQFTVLGVQFLKPPVYEAEVRFAVEKPASKSEASIDPFWFQGELVRLGSKQVLFPVITNLNLRRVWGERFSEGELSTEVVYALLKRSLVLEQSRGTALVVLSVRLGSPEEAVALANEIPRAYASVRLAEAQARLEVELKPLQAALDAARDDQTRGVLTKRIMDERVQTSAAKGGVEVVDAATLPARRIRTPIAWLLLPGILGVPCFLLGLWLVMRKRMSGPA